MSSGGFINGGGGGFVESDHPRDVDGKFASKGGSRKPARVRRSGRSAANGGSGKAPAVEAEAATPAQQAVLARQSSRGVRAEVQRYSEEHCEHILARGLRQPGVATMNLPDNEPMDVIRVRRGKIVDGVELKTMTSNKSGRITMRRKALARKRAWMAQNQADGHTVVFDDRRVFNAGGPGKHGPDQDRAIYYRRGFGSFSVIGVNGGMHRCQDMDELRALIAMPTAKLPPQARPATDYAGFK